MKNKVLAQFRADSKSLVQYTRVFCSPLALPLFWGNRITAEGLCYVCVLWGRLKQFRLPILAAWRGSQPVLYKKERSLVTSRSEHFCMKLAVMKLSYR